MANTISQAFVQQFADNLIMLAQQKGSRLLPTVMVKKIVGKYAHFDRLGKTSAIKRTSRHADTPIMDMPHSRRRVTIDDYEWGELIDSQDELRMIIDPRSAYAEAAAWSLGRSLDDIIIAALNGNAQSVDSSDASSNVALPASNIISVSFDATNTSLTFLKLNRAKRLLLGNDIDKDEQLYIVVNAASLHQLLTQTVVGSVDYNTVKALVNGEVDTFMGFKFIHSERILQDASGNDLIPCYSGTAVGLAMAQDIEVKMSERIDKGFATQVYARMTAGAVRVEEEKVVMITAYNTGL